MPGPAWPPAHVQALRDLAATMGGETAAILAEFATTHPQYRRTQVEPRLARVREEMRREASGIGEWMARRDAAVREARAEHRERNEESAGAWLQRVEVRPTPLQKIRARPTATTAILSDLHWPLVDEPSWTIACRTIEAKRPRTVLLNGDNLDLLALSKYDKDYRAGRYWTVADETAAMHRDLATLWQIVGAYGGRIVTTTKGANHDERWWKYLNQRTPELMRHPKAAALLDPVAWLYPDADVCPMEHVEEYELAPGLRVRHGEIVRGQSGASARAMTEKWGSSIVMGHVHRLGDWYKRVPALGDRPEGLVRGIEVGCLCDLNPSYVPGPNWQNGFALIHHDDANATWNAELIPIVNRRAIIPSLGMSVAA